MNEKALFFHETHSFVFEDSNNLYYINQQIPLFARPKLTKEQKMTIEGKNCFLSKDLKLNFEEISIQSEILTDNFIGEFNSLETARQIVLIDSEMFTSI